MAGLGPRGRAKPRKHAALGRARRRRADLRARRPGAGRGDRPQSTWARQRGGALDGGVTASTAILASLGIVMIYSATAPLAIGRVLPPHFVRHLVAVAVALVCIAGALRVPLTAWRRLALPLWGACTALLIATLVAGNEVNGARRWLDIPGLGLSFQPAEIAKLATLLAVAAALAGRGDRSTPRWRPVRAALVLTIVPAGLILLQPDFGSAVVLLVLVGLLLFVAGTPVRWLAVPTALAGASAAFYIAQRPYALARLRGFLNPWQTAHGEGYQLVQSFVAFGRGGEFGVGLGDGRQKLFYLPEAHTDFILSLVAEELGLAGVLVVLGAFAALVVAGTRIARRAPDPFTLLVAFGMTALIAVPAAVSAAVAMGLLPTTGTPLPFVSYGRSSLLTCSLVVGILLRIASREAQPRRARIADATPRGLVGS